MRLATKYLVCVFLFALMSACAGSPSSGGSDGSGNTAPVANAGSDQAVETNNLATLDGSSSSDGDGDVLTYSWSIDSQPGGASVTLSDDTVASPTFTPDLDGIYLFNLIVNDGTVDSSSDSVTLTASLNGSNHAPVADASSDQAVETGSLTTLDGSSSSDEDGDPLTYAWTIDSQPGGAAATLSDDTVVSPTFTPGLDGTYVFSLVVNDGIIDSSSDSVTVIASTSSNSAPVADAGDDGMATAGDPITLDGSGSSDPDSDEITYSWTITFKPGGDENLATLDNPTSVNPTLNTYRRETGPYTIELIVNDGSVDSAADEVVVNTFSGGE